MGAAAYLQLTATISASLSCAGSLLIIQAIFSRGGILHRTWKRTDVYLLVLSALDLGQSVAFAFGQLFLPDLGAPPSGACYTQAVAIQFFGVASMIWVAFLSWSVVVSLRPGCKPLSERRPTRKTLVPLAGTLAVAAASCIAVAATGRFGDASLWCWVVGGRHQLLVFYLPLLICWSVCLLALRVVRREVAARGAASGDAEFSAGDTSAVVRQARHTPTRQAACALRRAAPSAELRSRARERSRPASAPTSIDRLSPAHLRW